MKLYSRCTSCRSNIQIRGFMIDNRIELARKRGQEFVIRCKKCGALTPVHVDDIKAKRDFTVPLIFIFSLIPAIIITVFFWDYGFVSTFTVVLPIMAVISSNKNQRTKINLFNRMRYDSKRLVKKNEQ